MEEKMHNKIKDININLINNYNSDIAKNQTLVPNINTNLNTNSFSQENIFNEFFNSINLQESKNNSSFSESINSNPENQNIIMNKDQLYHIFILFQKLLNQNFLRKNNLKNEESTTNNTINNNNITRNKNIINDFYQNKSNLEINEKNENVGDVILKKNKSDTNIKDIKPKEENKNFQNIRETQNINIIPKKIIKRNPYDDIPIKLNTINFIELVEKKLADEENKNKKAKSTNKNKNYIRKIISKVKNKNNNNNIKIKEEKTNTYRESVNKLYDKNIIKRNNDKLINYSFDKEETKIIMPENKFTIENSIIDNMNTIFIKGENNKKKKEYIITKFNFGIKCINQNMDEIIDKYNEKEIILNKKIKEMNKEIIKLKEEQGKINKIKLEYEKYLTKLNNDIYQFSQKKEEFEKFRKNELNKIKNNKKNIILESKTIKEIKNKNIELINKSKKDKEIIELLKQQINNLRLKLKGKKNKSPVNTINNNNNKNRNNFSESKLNIMERINTQYKTNTHNSINNLFHNSIIEDKNKNIERINVSLKRNNTTNKKNSELAPKIIIKTKENELANNIYNKTSQNESGYLSTSQRILENSNKNERLIFSPIACKTSIGFGLKKISIKLNNSPKQNVRLQKKIYENMQYENQISNTKPEEEINEINNTNSRIKNNNIILKENKNIKKNINNYNSLSIINSPENTKKEKIKFKRKKNRRDILNKSANNNSKNKIEKKEYDFIIPKKYLNKEYKLNNTIKESDKIINIYTNDKKEIIYNNNIKKEIYKNNEHQIIYYPNGDIKQIFSDGKISYKYKDKKMVKTTLNNGIKIYKFKNGQIEKHFPDGTKLIIFNDDTEKYIYNDGSEETYFSDGNSKKNRDIIFEKTLEEDN